MKNPHQSGIVAGMDEAGRGSWAGPVVAAAVILPQGIRLGGLNDSKLLSPQKREELFEKITAVCPYGIGHASQEEVDEWGLLKATYYAFKRALESLPVTPDHIVIDGKDSFSFPIPHESIIRGDQKIRCIAAASIVAKVTRDHLMEGYGKQFPGYGFEIHKGYGTQGHQEALNKLGVSSIHRQSYQPIKQYLWHQEAF